ncbi:MAG: BatD family protein [Armatimonadetes bacterium]|nr:BatD family protein [Armatimonadota bacterium]
MARGKRLVGFAHNKRIFGIAVILAWALAGNFLNAQPPRSSVTLKRGSITLRVFLEEPKIPMGGIFLLKIQATAPGDLYGDAVKFELPAFWADRVVQLSAVSDRENFEQAGRIWTRITYTYRLAPLVLGRIRFDGLQVTVLKERFSIPTIEGVVVSGATEEPEQPAGPPVRVSAKVDITQAYVGEQVVYTFQFSALANVDFAQQPSYEAPSAEGFWVEEFPKIARSYQSGYEVQMVRMALFPLQAGNLKIGRSKVIVRLYGSSLADEYQTGTLQVKVKPLPQPSPEGFQNLVGQVIASVTVEPETVGVGETLSVKLRVEGTANLRNLEQPPTLSLPEAFVGLPREQLNTTERDGKLWFIRDFIWRIVPRKEGQLTIPAFRIPYFDPQAQKYKFASTKPITVRVLPGAILPTAVSPTVEPKTISPALPIAGLIVVLGLIGGAVGLKYWQRRRWLALVPVADPQLRQTVLTFRQQGATAFGREVRNWLREQVYQRTGVLLSPNDPPERVQQLLMEKGVSEAAARSIKEVWELTSHSLGWDEAVSLLQHASELPQRL